APGACRCGLASRRAPAHAAGGRRGAGRAAAAAEPALAVGPGGGPPPAGHPYPPGPGRGPGGPRAPGARRLDPRRRRGPADPGGVQNPPGRRRARTPRSIPAAECLIGQLVDAVLDEADRPVAKADEEARVVGAAETEEVGVPRAVLQRRLVRRARDVV